MINGNNGIVQLGFEATYGAAPTVMTKQIRVKSEGFKYVPNKKDDGLLTGGKTSGRTYTMSKGAEGAVSTIARPDEIGWWFAHALGKEGVPATVVGSTAVYKHTFTPCESDETLPSMRFSIDRVVNVFDYPGTMINTLSFSSASEDYLNLEMSLISKTEEIGSAQTPISVSPLLPFRFYHGKVLAESVELAGITSVKFDYNNNLEKVFTTQSGQFPIEPGVGMRELKMDFEMLYSTESDALRSDYFVIDDELEIELSFISDEEAETGFFYQFTINVPAAQILEMGPANLSNDKLKQTISAKAVQGSSEFVTIELNNLLATTYI